MPAQVSLNRRHKVILFTTLVLSGSGLLAGAELKETIGLMMLGAAMAWALGSDAAAKSYSRLKSITSTVYLWVRLPLAMTFSGLALGAVLLASQANPVATVGVMSLAGIVIAPFTSIPSRNIWLKLPTVAVAAMLFVLADLAVVSLFRFGASDAGHVGRLTGIGFLALLFGIWWLSKGWRLILEGFTLQTVSVSAEGPPRGAFGQYVSLFFGVVILTLWVGVLTWSASSDWAYGPQGKITGPKTNDNTFVQFAFVLLLAWWPYAAWKKILTRQSNAEYLWRHKATAVAAGMLFTVVLCLAATFGSQNGQDRFTVDQITRAGAEMKEVALKIGSLKRGDLKTTNDYIHAYAEIELLQPDFEAKIRDLSDLYSAARQRDEHRGPINIQRFYKSHNSEVWQNDSAMIELARQFSELTRQESLTVRTMVALPQPEQAHYWHASFRPLIEQEETLREKTLTLQKKTQEAQR